MRDTDDEILDLLLIPKVGRARAKALHTAGFSTAADIAQADPKRLAAVPGIGADMAKSIILSAKEILSEQSAAKEPQTPREILICPMCGSMVGAGSAECQRCGIVFSDEVDDIAPIESELEAGKSEKSENDGFWYKDGGKLFICPECGSMVSDGSSKCPKCGVVFEEGEEEAPSAPALPAEGPDGHWYKENSAIFMCPNCGSFINKDAGGCGNCGIVFGEDDGSEEETVAPAAHVCPMCGSEVAAGTGMCAECGYDFTKDNERDGFWYKENSGLFMCPDCGSFIPKSATKCGNCGAVLEEDDEPETASEAVKCPMCQADIPAGTGSCTECGFELSREKESDGFWYKDPVELFICPKCGAFLSEAAETCANCGLVFESEEEQETAVPKTDIQETAERNRALEKDADELIELVELEDELDSAAAIAPVEAEPEHIEEETSILPPSQALYLCPICGAFVQSGLLNCPACGALFDDIGEMELEPVGSVTVEAPAELAREMAQEIADIEAELLSPPKPKDEKKGGVSKDFLDRWKKLDGSADRIYSSRTDKRSASDIEAERALEEMLVQSEKAEPYAAAVPAEPDGESPEERARRLASEGRTDEAVAHLDRAAEDDPDREMEYKRLMLELMGVPKADTAVDISDISEIDDIGELSIDADVLSEKDISRLAEIDLELKTNPEENALWQEKGEILERLGRHEEAVACFDMSIGLTYAELRKESKDPGAIRKAQLGVGLTNGEGRVNGRVNGLMVQRGLSNGDSAGRTNGLTNVKGKINGMVNGLARGRVNGRVNGLTNGRTNGRGLVNGRKAGSVNGLPGRINGSGMINGRSNGLVNGGLVNGMGLVNGEALIDGSGSFKRLRSRRRERIRWRYRLSAMVLFVTLVLMISMLSNLIVEEGGMMQIDGDFSDWEEIDSYYNFMTDAALDPDLIIRETRFAAQEDRVSIFVMFGGDAFAGESGDVTSLWALIDIDPTADTGYPMNGMGVDLMAEIYGWDNAIRGSGLSRFGTDADRDDWNGFTSIGSVSAQMAGPRLEASVNIPRDMMALVDGIEVQVMTANSAGEADITDYMMSDSAGGTVAEFSRLGSDTITPGDGVVLGQIALSAHSDAESEFTEMTFRITGLATAADISNPVLTDAEGNTVQTSVTSLDAAGFTLSFHEPEAPGLNQTELLTLRADVMQSADGKTLGIELAGANCSAGEPTVRNTQTILQYVGTPTGLAVDGAFGDWAAVQGSDDPVGDVISQTPNATFLNANIDLTEVRLGLQDDGALYYQFAVDGVALGGDSVPTVRHRPGPVTPPQSADSDRDTVPDSIDIYPQDFSNDGIDDAQALTPSNHPDVDGDGAADYPDGQDWWINTTIPSDFPSPYTGREISIYIGPINSTYVENKGDDRAYVLIDADGNTETGLDLKGGFGIDYTAVISGKGNRILASELYSYDPASQTTGWVFEENITAALDWTRIEGSLNMAAMGIEDGHNFSVFISLEDWRGSRDSVDTMPPPETLSIYTASGTRSPAGDNIVINELVTLPATGEFVEICNPTAAAINIGGWRLRTGNTDLIVFPTGTVLGAFGSGTEYYTLTLYAAANNLPNAGGTVVLQRLVGATWTTQDSFTYGATATGQSWARFKNVTYGMPTDTDSAADYYVSAAPTPGAPNDRTAPSIAVSKTGDRSYASPGDAVTYTIWYNNTGDGAARHVWVNDTLPSGMTFVTSGVPYTSAAGQTYSWHFTYVAPGIHSFTVTASVDAGVPTGTVLTNSVQLQYTDQLSRPRGTSSDSWAVTVQVPPPSIALSKVTPTPQMIAGSNVDFMIYYNNTGVGPASHVWLNDTLPSGLTYVTATPAPTSVSGQNIFWHFTDLAPGNYMVSATAQIGAGLPVGTVLTNTASCDYKDTAGTSLPSSADQATVTVASAAALIVINEVAPNPNPEWVELSNPTDAAVNIGGWYIYAGNFLRFTFPAGTVLGAWGSGSEYIVATMTQNNRFSDAGGLVRLTTGTGAEIDRTTYPAVANGQTWSRFKHEDTGMPSDSGSSADWYISNGAWLVPEGPTPAAPNDRKRPIMNVEKSAVPTVAEPGQIITYTLWYNNTGDGNAKSVWVNDTLPAGIAYVSASPAPASVSGQNIVWFFGTVLHDSVNSVTLTAQMTALPTDGNILTNSVSMVYHDALKRPMGTSADTADIACSRAEITVVKVADVAETTAGGTVVYTIHYNNTGSANAGSVWINDTLPAGVTFVSASIPPDTVSGLALSWHLTNIAPGAHSLTVTVTVNATAGSGTLTNWAYLSYASGYGWNLGPSSDSATVIIPEMQHLILPVLGILIIIIATEQRRKSNGRNE
ncbi:MAG: lamin tail domain-containing protein [Thermoplasmata archaeon]|nr:lamin tail domain-containing protein [Thermoplasmata archaeon]